MGYESKKIVRDDSADALDAKNALARLRSLYYKNKIGMESKGKKGGLVTHDKLLDMDLKSIQFLNSRGWNSVSSELKKFAEELLSQEKNK